MYRRLESVPLSILAIWLLIILPARLIGDERTSPPANDGSADSELANDKLKSNEDEEYFELLKLFADTIDQVERNYVEPIDKRELMEAAIKGVLSKLDPYSDFISPDGIEDFRTEVESQFGGIGIRVGAKNDRIYVVTPLYDTPAHRAGIVAGDVILKIGDTDTRGLELDAAIQLMKGKIGTTISLSIRHESGETELVELKRQVIQLETVMGRKRGADGDWDFMLDADQRIGYIRVFSFSRATADDVQKAVTKLMDSEARGLILDLRLNPGGLLSCAIEIADMFLKEGIIVGTQGRNIEEQTWTASSDGTIDDIPMIVLVNQYSASASEIVSAALQDHERAIVIGNRTWGKGSVQNIIELEGGKSALKLTTASYTRPNGKNIHRFKGATEEDEWGVRPSAGFEIAMSPQEVRDLVNWNYKTEIIHANGATPEQSTPFKDRQLQRAVEHLTAKLANSHQQEKQKAQN